MAPDSTDAQPAGAPRAEDRDNAAFGTSYFAAHHLPAPKRAALTQDIDVDVCVIGAGLAGLTTARELARRGYSVAVLESRRIAWNASGRNTGFVLPGFSQGADVIADRVGIDSARELWGLSQAGVDYIRGAIVEGEMRDIAPTEGWLHVSKTDRPQALTDEAEFLRGLGADVEFWPASLVRSKLKTDSYFQAIHYPTAFNIHPLNYALELARLAEAAGARIFEETPALSIDPAGVRKRIATASGRVRAAQIVLAGNVHLGVLTPELSKTLLPLHTFVIVTRPLGPALAEAIDYPGSVSDTDRADNHYRIVGGDRLMWSGRVSVWDANPKLFGRALRRDLRRRFPQLAAAAIDYLWGGTLGLTVHRMPQIGEYRPGVWVLSGFGGHGLNTTAMGGNLIASAISEGDDRWRLFQPFELVWAGGRTGRIVFQTLYWGRRKLENWANTRDRRREAFRIRDEPRRKIREEKAAVRAEEKRIRAEQRAAEKAAADRIKAEQKEARRIEAERVAAEKTEAARIAAERAEAERRAAATESPPGEMPRRS